MSMEEEVKEENATLRFAVDSFLTGRCPAIAEINQNYQYHSYYFRRM